MNRHASLFRAAFVSLLMAVGLPLLVLAAAQVRHRQLQSKANPRWSQFQAVNASRPETVSNTHPDAATGVVAKASPAKTAIVKTASLKPTAADPALDTPVTEEAAAVRAVPSKVARQQLPAHDSGTRSASLKRPLPAAEPEQRQAEAPQQPTVAMEAAAPRRVADAASSQALVPAPDDLPEPISPPAATYRPRIEFRALQDARPADESNRQIEARLAGMQQKLDQLAQLQTDKQFSDLEKTLNLLRQVQQNQAQQGQQILQSIPGVQNATPNRAADTTPTLPSPSAVPPAPPAAGIPGTAAERPAATRAPGRTLPAPATREPSIRILQDEAGEDGERFSIQVQDASLAEVLEMLGQLSGVNILTTPDVQGRVSLNLQDVTIDRALEAILKSQGYVFVREGDFIYVRTSAEAQALELANRKLVTKVYQLHYIAAAEIQKLIEPVLTKEVGRQAVTTPAMTGIAPMASNAGGDGLAGRDTLLVQDYPNVIEEIDKIVVELDVPPLQVMIEAKILSVALSDAMAFGVNFAMLNGAQNSQVLSGNGAVLNGAVGFPDSASLVPATGDFLANTAGLKYGFIQGDVSGFIKALETIADVNLVAAPQLRVLNKQKAEMIIGERLSYKTLAFNGTQTVENVQFLDAGTKLIFRPFISPDGMVRLEVHPERSKAVINETTGLPNSETTEVTTNVMVRDGTTVVLGGLISEESSETIERVPFLGAIPVIGTAFRNKSERVQRNELIVLITPRLVAEPEAAIEGETLKFETQQRAAYFRDHLSPVNRTSLTRAHYDRACLYYEQGHLLKAKQQIEAALRQHKGDLECQRMKTKIDQALQEQQSRAWKWPLGRTASR